MNTNFEGRNFMNRIVLLAVFFALSVINQVRAEGAIEGERLHPGAVMMLEKNGYRFDSNGRPISYNNRSIMRFPNEDDTNTNPHSYNKDIIYLTNFDANQWIDKSILATTGSQYGRQMARTLLPGISAIGGMGKYGTRIFIKDIPDRFLKEINSSVKNAFLVYTGVQTFQMADGSSQVFPVFQLTDFFGNVVSQAIRAFNNAFDAGIYKTEDGYQYSRISGRTFGRDIATKKELLEWNGNQWIVLIGG